MHLLELQPLVSWFRLRMHGRVWVESAFWYRQWLGYNYQRGPHICCLQGFSLHILEVISCWSFRFPCLQLQMYIYPWNVQALRDCYCFAQINMNKSSERERGGERETSRLVLLQIGLKETIGMLHPFIYFNKGCWSLTDIGYDAGALKNEIRNSLKKLFALFIIIQLSNMKQRKQTFYCICFRELCERNIERTEKNHALVDFLETPINQEMDIRSEISRIKISRDTNFLIQVINGMHNKQNADRPINPNFQISKTQKKTAIFLP